MEFRSAADVLANHLYAKTHIHNICSYMCTYTTYEQQHRIVNGQSVKVKSNNAFAFVGPREPTPLVSLGHFPPGKLSLAPVCCCWLLDVAAAGAIVVTSHSREESEKNLVEQGNSIRKISRKLTLTHKSPKNKTEKM